MVDVVDLVDAVDVVDVVVIYAVVADVDVVVKEAVFYFKPQIKKV